MAKIDKEKDDKWPIVISMVSATIAILSLFTGFYKYRLDNATEQPYVVPKYPLSVGYRGLKYTLEHRLSFVNLGKTPAINVRYRVEFKSNGQRDGDSCSHFFRIASHSGIPYRSKGFSIQNLGAGDTFRTYGLFQNGVGSLITDRSFLIPKTGGGEFWPVHICIVIFYKTIFNGQIRGEFSFETPIIDKEKRIIFPNYLNKYDGGQIILNSVENSVPIYMSYARFYHSSYF